MQLKVKTKQKYTWKMLVNVKIDRNVKLNIFFFMQYDKTVCNLKTIFQTCMKGLNTDTFSLKFSIILVQVFLYVTTRLHIIEI